MKCYKANDELIEILKKQNFIETSDKRDIIKGKKDLNYQKVLVNKLNLIT